MKLFPLMFLLTAGLVAQESANNEYFVHFSPDHYTLIVVKEGGAAEYLSHEKSNTKIIHEPTCEWITLEKEVVQKDTQHATHHLNCPKFRYHFRKEGNSLLEVNKLGPGRRLRKISR